MRIITVNHHTLRFNGKAYACAIGKGGIITAEKKHEGDGCTPAGSWPLRECWYRADRMPQPQTTLPLRIITPDDGWCDDPAHALYNRHVALPFAAHHENLWLEDAVYDLIVPLGYNDNPPVAGKGSAIFLHVARLRSGSEAIAQHTDYSPTEGCVALKKEDLLEVLAGVQQGTTLEIA